MSETPKMSNAEHLTFYRLLTISTAQCVEPLGGDFSTTEVGPPCSNKDSKKPYDIS